MCVCVSGWLALWQGKVYSGDHGNKGSEGRREKVIETNKVVERGKGSQIRRNIKRER
jgi:hypothetical protein